MNSQGITGSAVLARAGKCALVVMGVCLFAMPKLAAQVWDGGAGTGAWGTWTNWNPNGVPGNGADLTFDAANANSQWAITLGGGRTVGSMTFNSAAGTNAFTFSGNTLTINGTGITNSDAQTQIINSAVRITSAQSWNAAPGGLTFNGTVRLGSDLTLSGTGNISVAGTLTNYGANRTITNNGTGAVTFGNISLSNSNTARTLTFSGSGATTVSGVIANYGTGADTLTKTGTGTLTLSGANTYTGGTNINVGTLALGGSERLANNGAVTVAGGATFNLNSYTETIGALSGAGIVTLGSGTLTVGSGNTSSTFSGSFTSGDTGTFAKTGTGTLTFGAGMNLAGGTLQLAGGTLNLGNFSSTFGSLSVTANSILDFGTGGSSILNLNSVSVNSGVTLTIQNWTDAVDYFYSLINPGAGNLGRIVFSGHTGPDTKWLPYDHQITPVPEPSVYGAVLLGLSTVFAAWRLRRRQE